MLKEFRDFAMRGNVIDLAIAVIIGAAFKRSSTRRQRHHHADHRHRRQSGFHQLFLPLSSAVTATNLADARKQGGVLAYGDFITIAVNFLIIAPALFLVVKGINSLKKARRPRPPRPRRRATKSCC